MFLQMWREVEEWREKGNEGGAIFPKRISKKYILVILFFADLKKGRHNCTFDHYFWGPKQPNIFVHVYFSYWPIP
jgi:hypothetical protein